MAITASGIGSGLDVDSLVSQLLAAERAPTDNRLLRQEAVLTSELSAFGSLKGALSSLQNSLSGLLNVDTFRARSATVSDADVLSVSAGKTAVSGNYDIAVTQLAKSHSLASGVYTATTDVVGEGEITFRFGTTDYDVGSDTYTSFTVNPDKTTAKVTIDSTNSTLEGIRAAINNAEIGINASIVNDGSGYRLMLSSDDTGAKNSLEVSVVESGAAGLGQLAFNATTTNLTQTVAAQDAQLTINGLAINSASNTVSGAIEDVDLTLLSTTSGAPVSVAVARDKDAVKGQINSFISAYNSFIKTVNSLSGFDAETLEGGVLLGDSVLRSITGRIRGELNAAIGGTATLQRLADIGVTTAADDTLALDATVLDGIFDTNIDALEGLFTAHATTTDGLIKFVSSTDKTQPGTYPISISQLATQAEYQGDGVLPDFSMSSVVVDSNNDAFTIKVDGTTSGEINLTQATYTSGADLASEVAAKINADSVLSGAGITVTVTYDATNNRLQINSTSYGSDSKVEITQVDTTSAATLGLTAAAGTAGVNVAGTIGGVTATGTGQILTGGVGSSVEGMVLEITGGTTGGRGTLTFNRGIAENLNNLLADYVATDSILDLRTNSLSSRIEDIGEQRDRFNSRMETVEARLRARFNALDLLVAQLQQTSTFLTQQLANLPGAFDSNKN